MTARKNSFGQTIAGADRRRYSLNLLLADYLPVVDHDRDQAILDDHQPCREYGSRDFAAHRFYKHITTPLGRVGPGGGADDRAQAPEPDRHAIAAQAGSPAAYFVSWACCIAVEGHARSIVCDLQRSTFVFIPNVVVEILELCKDKTIAEVHAHYGGKHDQEIDDYLAYLVAGDYGFFSATPQRFPALSLDWRNPRPITNCVIDFDDTTEHPLDALSAQLSRLSCQALEMRFFRAVTAAALDGYLQPFVDSTIRSISLIVGHDPSLDRAALDQLLRRHKRVKQITIHSTDHDEVIRIDLQTTLRFTREVVSSEACCGQVSPSYFSCNVETFTESLQLNHCLDRKLGIDARGTIRNCPSMARGYGDVRTTALAEVVARDDFQAVWKINKDQVLVCQDCEFRYICHDCRAYVADPDQPLSKPAKCRYNPYEGRWE